MSKKEKLLITVPSRGSVRYFDRCLQKPVLSDGKAPGKLRRVVKRDRFIDGTKLEVCANKDTFVWKKSVRRWEEKMLRKIQPGFSHFIERGY